MFFLCDFFKLSQVLLVFYYSVYKGQKSMVLSVLRTDTSNKFTLSFLSQVEDVGKCCRSRILRAYEAPSLEKDNANRK